ncbi:hypothetical protein FRC04_000863 [Tulasnella sp. 424]|nr:hypothetical protein FRC04_000863 [Tulasnella sp. 424]KAG8975401.1 hypothetical protein FRC05_005731 [Tulasnella sp. 425]
MDEPSPTPTPPWVSEDLPEGNWHIDADFLREAYSDLEDLAETLKSDTITEALDNIFEEECDCGSLDGAQSDPDEMEETFCPDRSNFKSDYNRTFLILEQMLPRLKFAKQKIDTMIDAFTERQADLVPYSVG